MNVKELIPLPNKRIRFDISSFKSVPKDSGCYILTTFTENILYVGLAINLYSRFIQHLNNPEKTNPTIEGKAVWFYYQFYNKFNLPQLERTWLNQFEVRHCRLPILNKTSSPIS